MKKFLATILALVYLTTSMGATIHFHYCMGRLVSWGLHDHEGKNCSFCGMSKKIVHKNCLSDSNNCCKDEHKLIKSNKDQKVSQSEFQVLKLAPCQSLVNGLKLLDIHISSINIAHPTAKGPPRSSEVQLFLLFSNFRI